MYDIEYQKDDVGSVFDITMHDRRTGLVKPIDDVAVKQIRFEKPDGVDFVVTASFSTNGTDGRMKHTWIAGQLNVTGMWKAQGYVEWATGLKLSSTVIEFMVYDNI